jgi:hypothetical protein
MNETWKIIASLSDYDGAQAIVDDLAEQGFPVDQLAIVGAALQISDRTAGRRRYAHSVFGDMFTGAVVGAMVGWLLGMLNLVESLATSTPRASRAPTPSGGTLAATTPGRSSTAASGSSSPTPPVCCSPSSS